MLTTTKTKLAVDRDQAYLNVHGMTVTIQNEMMALVRSISSLEKQMRELEALPMMEGREWWKDDKYLYICYPTTPSGQRPRTYIGADPEAIEQARDQIKRKRLYENMKDELSGKTRDFNRFYRELQQLNSDLGRIAK